MTPVVGFFHDVQGDLLVLRDLALLVLGLLAAIHLRIAQRVRQEDVVVAAKAVVTGDVLGEVTARMLGRRRTRRADSSG